MQQDNTIENKLQQLENQRLPDLSQMDAHWAAMEATLLADQPRPGRYKRWWLALAAIVITGGMFILLKTKEQNQLQQPPVASVTGKHAGVKPDSTPTSRTVTSGDTIKLIQAPPVKHRSGGIRSVAVADTVLKRIDTVYFNLNFIDCSEKTKKKLVSAADRKQQREEQLTTLMTALEKAPSGYTVNNHFDTTLACTDGTIISIPAGSLGGASAVQLLVKEFYKKSEFVLNKLSATSNRTILESGGMLHITAAVNGMPVNIAPGFSIRIYMANDAGSKQGMQLFTGEKATLNLTPAESFLNGMRGDTVATPVSVFIDWTPVNKYFSQLGSSEEARVTDLLNEPARIKETGRGRIGVFYRAPGAALSRRELKKQLENKYDYYKIRVKKLRTKGWFRSRGNIEYTVGDSAWLDKTVADRYKLPYTRTRIVPPRLNQGRYGESFFTGSIQRGLDKQFGIDIGSLGWINCDRFYNDSREKIEYVVRLGDATYGYTTLLVFDRLNAVVNGYGSGSEISFPGVPVGEPVTVVSIGVNAAGKTVYGIEKSVVAKEGLSGINYIEAAPASIKSSLQKLDQ